MFCCGCCVYVGQFASFDCCAGVFFLTGYFSLDYCVLFSLMVGLMLGVF